MLASGNRAVMGERTNGRVVAAVGWITTIVMSLAAIALIVTTLL
jgi:Mn2+/Fe2+ NRAMP family transporter